MVGYLLNYFTLGIAGIFFIVLLGILLLKRRELSIVHKSMIWGCIGLLVLYFTFVVLLTIGFGSVESRVPIPISD